MKSYSTQEILTKLKEVLGKEGLRIISCQPEDGTSSIHINMERFAPGLPAAFMVKALQGTFRRYGNPEAEVILDDYIVLPEAKNRPSESSEQLKEDIVSGLKGEQSFAKVTGGHKLFKSAAGLKLEGGSAQDYSAALELFMQMMQRRGIEEFAVYAADREALRVLRQWGGINEAWIHKARGGSSLWAVHCGSTVPAQDQRARHETECSIADEAEIIPCGVLTASINGPAEPD